MPVQRNNPDRVESWDADGPIVVKASGLCAGKGVILCQNVEEGLKAIDEIMVDKARAFPHYFYKSFPSLLL